MSVTLTYGPRMVENCDAVWTAATGNITCLVEATDATLRKEGIGSAKIAIASGFTTGIAAYKNITSTDLSYATALRFWILSSVDCTENHMQLVLDNTAACASPLEFLDIGDLSANTWSQQTIYFATPANLTAVTSVGLRITSDFGAATIYLDRIEIVTESRTFNELHAIGFDNPENEKGFPAADFVRLLDGSGYKNDPVVSYRTMTVILRTQDIGEKVFLRNFQYGQNQQVVYAGETVTVTTVSNDFMVQRTDNTKTSQLFVLNLEEKTARALNVLPSSYV